jgi:hypothetical protein
MVNKRHVLVLAGSSALALVPMTGAATANGLDRSSRAPASRTAITYDQPAHVVLPACIEVWPRLMRCVPRQKLLYFAPEILDAPPHRPRPPYKWHFSWPP